MNNKIIKTSYLYSILFALVAFTTISCKKFLQEDPKSAFGTDYIFGSVDDANKAVIGAYQALSGDYSFGGRVVFALPLDDDLMVSSRAYNDVSNNGGGIAHYTITAPYTNQALINPWTVLYNGIERANICIKFIPAMDAYNGGTDEQKKALRKLYGEVLTLRAFYLSEAVKYWGDIPAFFEPASFIADHYVDKTDRHVIYDRILDDLQEAADLLPWRTESPDYPDRISQGAARALRARIALFAGGYSLRQDGQMKRQDDYLKYYQIVKDETAALMARRDQHTLNPSYKAVFKNGICGHTFDPFGETIFEAGQYEVGAITGSKLGYTNGPRLSQGSAGNAIIKVLPTYFYMFEPTDTRRDVTITYYKIDVITLKRTPESISSDVCDGKFRRDWISNPSTPLDGSSTTQNFGLNWPVIRFSDVLLMYAEAENELNGPAGALSAINEVRSRAGSLQPITAADKNEFFEALVKERALEFGGEALRKFDLIRWNLLRTKIQETSNTLYDIAVALRDGTELPAPYNNYPRRMYLKDTGNDAGLTAGNSFYEPEPDTAPAGYTDADMVNWISNIRSASGTVKPPLANVFGNYAYGFNFTEYQHELLPIPDNVISVNPKILQNPNY